MLTMTFLGSKKLYWQQVINGMVFDITLLIPFLMYFRYTMIAAKVFVAKLIKEFKFFTKLTEKDMKMKLAFTGKLASKYLVSIKKRS